MERSASFRDVVARPSKEEMEPRLTKCNHLFLSGCAPMS
jgi:hypothetical protein